MEKATGGRLVASMLHEEGVDTIFGIVDGTYLRLFASCVDLGMRMVTPRHESTGMHMAGAFARLTGRLGVCIASNGPGVANVLPGVAVENAEGNRVLLLTSCRRPQITDPDRGGAYQSFDQVGVISAMSKWSRTVRSPDRLAELARAALRECYRGRPGVVHLDVPESIWNGVVEAASPALPHEYRRTAPIHPAPSLVDAAADLLAEAELPVVHAGSGVTHALAFAELAELARLLHAPVTTSWAARGVFPETEELAFPMVHIEAVNAVRARADVVLCLGSDLGETDWWGKPPYWAPPSSARLVQVDVDEACLGRARPAALPILADAKVFLAELLERLRGRAMDLAGRRARVAELARARDEHRRSLDAALEDRGSPMLTAHVAAACREVFDDDAIVVFDGGNSAVWGNFYSQIRTPSCQLGTHHFGHLGAGLGQALGAAVARPRSQVFCITGDGAMGFHPQEIETAVRNDLRVVFLVCCDRQWGMVKLTQSMGLDPVRTVARKLLGPAGEPIALPWKLPGGGEIEKAALGLLGPLKDVVLRSLGASRTVNADLGEIRWDDLARAMGAHGERVSDPAELGPALGRCLEAGRAAVVHVDVDPAKHLWAPGLRHFKAMHQEPKGA